MKKPVLLLNLCPLLALCCVTEVCAQNAFSTVNSEEEWSRTREIMHCAPRIADRRDLVEDRFDHSYITDNPRDIEVAYFSVEPVTYLEMGRRFCEASLPAAGVSESYFRGSYETSYTLPGEGVFRIEVESDALIFNNEIRVIDAQPTLANIEARHRVLVRVDTLSGARCRSDQLAASSSAYQWDVEVDGRGGWHGQVKAGAAQMSDMCIPAGESRVTWTGDFRGPGTITIRESVIFRVNAFSSFKYEPIFQALCLFSLEPLSVTARLLPCEK